MKARSGLVILVIFVALLIAAPIWIRPPKRLTAPAHQHRSQLALLGEPEAGLPLQAPADEEPAAAGRAKSRVKTAEGPKVAHRPEQPKSGQAVLITADFSLQTNRPGPWVLEYQTVDPGKYIALRDAAFQKQWISLPMHEQTNQSQSAGVFTVEIPAQVQTHRRLVRYRIRSAQSKTVVAPEEGDAQPNYAYFVYDGLPAWRGAIDPKSRDSTLSQAKTYPPEALDRVPVYHFISSKRAVETVTWSGRDPFGSPERNAYKYTGTMVYDGVVYDHVGFRARGGAWRHAMGKNMWKFNFLPGHRFAARDFYGNRYRVKWDKLNLGACIQQGDYGMRGEQGMFEAVGFRLFNLAGMEAPETHWVHLRIIDAPEEAPSNQYAGDFWGLYLAVENVDEHFLKEHELPPGNLYKIDFRPKLEFNGNPAVTNQADVNAFLRATQRGQQPESWWLKNFDVSRYYRYRSIIECIHHYDVEGGKNYFYYLNPKSGQWIVIPWDIDLTWGDNMFGGGHEPFARAGLTSQPPFKQQYQERLAEIRDLLFNPEQMSILIDEHAAMISDPKSALSLADADRAKWDYNPIMQSQYAMPWKAGQGRFYFADPRNTFQIMVKYMKSYATKRAKWIDSRLLSDYRPPAAPKVINPGALDYSAAALAFQLGSKSETPMKSCQWRLAEITKPNSAFDPKQPRKYEIQALWRQEVEPSMPVAIPRNLVAAGHTYRVRARWQDETSAWSRWSSAVEFTVPANP